MAIGIALLLGFRFPQNFDGPYTATSLQDFWRRWHMTLSRWLRDYLYIPLGGNRGGKWKTYRNLMITIVLGGLWHGAAWTFVVWGAIHGGFLSLEHWRRTPPAGPGTPRPARHRLAPLGRPVRHLPHRVLRLGLLPGRVVHERGGHPHPPVRPGQLGRTLAAREDLRAARDRRRHRRAVHLEGRAGPARWPGSRGSRRSSRASSSASRSSIINTMGPRGVAPFIYFRF